MRFSLRVVLAVAAAAVTSIPAFAISSVQNLTPATATPDPIPTIAAVKLELEPDVVSLHAQRNDLSLKMPLGHERPIDVSLQLPRDATTSALPAAATGIDRVESDNPVRLRRLASANVPTELVAEAQRLIRSHYQRPLGTEIPLEMAGRHFVAKLEIHYHPEGGAVKPWGYHRGISLFTAETASKLGQ